ncbi:hypothetical protein E2542_SST06119 [Spatholobus suberectus]|nr:hypothetical protein E2542_SST06119 [Spatholobus suberectus]
MYEEVCDLVVFPMEKTSKTSREAADCKSPSWPRKALPTHYSSHPRPKGKKASDIVHSNSTTYSTRMSNMKGYYSKYEPSIYAIQSDHSPS